MPNQSLSGKWKDILNELAESTYFDMSGKGSLIVYTALKALKSCLAEEIRGMKIYCDAVTKGDAVCKDDGTCASYLSGHCLYKKRNWTIDEVLRRIE